jgi:hypothetical protein
VGISSTEKGGDAGETNDQIANCCIKWHKKHKSVASGSYKKKLVVVKWYQYFGKLLLDNFEMFFWWFLFFAFWRWWRFNVESNESACIAF